MSMLSLTMMAAPQSADINKPTRERVRDKKNDSKKNDSKKTDSKKSDAKKADSKAAPAIQSKDEGDKKSQQAPAAKPAQQAPAAKEGNDTAKKPAAPSKPKVRQTTNPDNVQYDGIDISKHQGDINWELLQRFSKIKFVYIKATEGGDYTDPRYYENLRNARKHGYKVGSYHFLSTKTSVMTQFRNFITVAKREDQDLLPVIDVERLSPWSPQQLRDSLKLFADLLEDHYGCKPMIYTSEKFFTKNLGRAFADYPLFIAKYNTVQPNIGYKWIIWQFTDNGLFKPAVKGNYGEVDMSRFNKGCSINDLLYHPSKHKPRGTSVRDAVDHKDKPSSVNMTEQKTKEAPKPSKRQQEEARKQAEKDRKAKERDKKIAEQQRKKKEEADKKAREKAEQQKKAAARQKAREDAAKKQAEEKAKKQAEEKAKKQAEEKAKKQAEEKAKRKASAQQAKQQKAQRQAAGSKSGKQASLLGTSSSRLSQSQKNDSIRNARNQGRKTNKSSADND